MHDFSQLVMVVASLLRLPKLLSTSNDPSGLAVEGSNELFLELSSFSRRHSKYTTLLSFDLWRDCFIKNVVLFEENSILPLPECLESSGW